jgi:hypothetical protein
LPFPALWIINLEFWLELHWICKLLSARGPFLLYQSCQSMTMGELFIFWDLLPFFSSEIISSHHTDFSLV